MRRNFGAILIVVLLAAPSDAALVGHWQFDDPGNLGLDSAGGDNNGTDIDDLDTSFSASARVGAGALSITGLGTGLELANSDMFQPLTTFTIAAFVNADRDNPDFGAVGRVFSSLRTPTGDLTNGNNGYGFSNEEFDAKADECDTTVDDAARDACYNELDRYVTTLELDPQNGLFMIPLTQKPSFYAYSRDRLAQAAVAPDANSAGPLVNVVDFVLN